MDLSRQFEPRDAAVAAPTAGALVAVAAVVTAVVALLNPPGGGAPARVLAVGVPALLLTSLGLLSRRGRRPTPLLTVIPLIGLLAITGLDLATSDASISGYIYFCYPVLYAASQLRPGAATAVTATAVALSAVVAFALTPPGRAVVDVAYLATTMVAITVVLVRTGSRQDTIVRALEEGSAH
ncbi:hypothetical protein [Cellulomonas sp. ATA003]|uniref:hypothetical protein n=1 Tax=Cellulomonas sp. ATA003 TaxID=3073064 RepID=UPI0028737FC1|nr:hypothetical protein [Cellulomonas sp. ATA003]WNB87666.1 hypothetical protein REH70_07270 [Cellulomonas sp. ATA003]